MSSNTIYYVYRYNRENGTPYYIGKGKEDRCYSKSGRSVDVPPKNRIVIVQSGMTESESLELERHLIAEFGRLDIGTGILENKCSGGQRGPSGCIRSPEVRQKIRESLTGKKMSPESSMRKSKKLKGQTKSQEWKDKIGKGNEIPEHIKRLIVYYHSLGLPKSEISILLDVSRPTVRHYINTYTSQRV